MEPWQVSQAIKLLQMVRFLLQRADQKGLTHGEKHYLIQTALFLQAEALDALGDMGAVLHRNDTANLLDLSDIPF